MLEAKQLQRPEFSELLIMYDVLLCSTEENTKLTKALPAQPFPQQQFLVICASHWLRTSINEEEAQNC